MADKITTVPKSKIGKRAGRLDDQDGYHQCRRRRFSAPGPFALSLGRPSPAASIPSSAWACPTAVRARSLSTGLLSSSAVSSSCNRRSASSPRPRSNFHRCKGCVQPGGRQGADHRCYEEPRATEHRTTVHPGQPLSERLTGNQTLGLVRVKTRRLVTTMERGSCGLPEDARSWTSLIADQQRDALLRLRAYSGRQKQQNYRNGDPHPHRERPP
jgi:hypothetical protein